MSGDRAKALEVLRTKVNAEHGGRTMGYAGKLVPDAIPRLATGSLAFDFVLGGGVPVGRVTILRGGESSGKTSAALRIVGIAQGLCANCLRPAADLHVEEAVDRETGEVEWRAVARCDCVAQGRYVAAQRPGEAAEEFAVRQARYVTNSYEEFRAAFMDAEGAFDGEWASCLGVDVRRLLLVTPSTAEEAVDIYDSVLRTGAVDLFVLDSIAALTPSKEVSSSMEDWQQGLAARLINKMARKTMAGNNAVAVDWGRPVTHLWINQEREKIGMAFGDTTVMPGGKGQLFAASVIVKMWASKWERAVVDEGVKKEHQEELGTAVRMNLKVVKNKTAPAQGQGSYVLAVRGERQGQALEDDYVESQAERFGLLRKEDKGWALGDERYRTRREAVARMLEPATFQEIRRVLLARMLAAAAG